MKLHPLLNPKSPHYGNGKDATIYDLWDRYSVIEMRSWCLINAEKYHARKGKKQGESEQDNQEKYESFYYTALLVDCVYVFDSSFAKKILNGELIEEELITKLESLRKQVVHLAKDKILLEVLEYMNRG